MTAAEYRAALAVLGMTQDAAAEFLDVSLRSSHGYANDQPVPLAIAKLLRLMIKHGIKPDEVK